MDDVDNFFKEMQKEEEKKLKKALLSQESKKKPLIDLQNEKKKAEDNQAVIPQNDTHKIPQISMTHGPAQILSLLQQDFNRIEQKSNTPKPQRLNSLKNIQNAVSSQPIQFLKEIFPSLYQPLLRAFSDPAESCREIAVDTFLDILKTLKTQAVECLPYLLPVLLMRWKILEGGPTDSSSNVLKDADILEQNTQASVKFEEPSEEIRLKTIKIVDVLVSDLSNIICTDPESLTVICEILCAAQCDFSHSVKQDACNVLISLTQIVETIRMKAKEIIKHIKPNLVHQRSSVRMHAIRAITSILIKSSCEELEDLKKVFKNLAVDHSHQVRQELLNSLIKLYSFSTLTCREDYEGYFLLLLLILCTDDIPQTRDSAYQLILNKLSKIYMICNRKEIEETKNYSKFEASEGPVIYDFKDAQQASSILPPIFKSSKTQNENPSANSSLYYRPPLETRLFVQHYKQYILDFCMDRIKDFSGTNRVAGIRVLQLLVVFCENTLIPSTSQILSQIYDSMLSYKATNFLHFFSVNNLRSVFPDSFFVKNSKNDANQPKSAPEVKVEGVAGQEIGFVKDILKVVELFGCFIGNPENYLKNIFTILPSIVSTTEYLKTVLYVCGKLIQNSFSMQSFAILASEQEKKSESEFFLDKEQFIVSNLSQVLPLYLSANGGSVNSVILCVLEVVCDILVNIFRETPKISPILKEKGNLLQYFFLVLDLNSYLKSNQLNNQPHFNPNSSEPQNLIPIKVSAEAIKEAQEFSEKAVEILHIIACITGKNSIDDYVEENFSQIFQKLNFGLKNENVLSQIEIFSFESLISLATGSIVQQLDKFFDIFQFYTNFEKTQDSGLVLRFVVLLNLILSKKKEAVQIEHLVSPILEKFLLPNMKWRSGRMNLLLRKATFACLTCVMKRFVAELKNLRSIDEAYANLEQFFNSFFDLVIGSSQNWKNLVEGLDEEDDPEIRMLGIHFFQDFIEILTKSSENLSEILKKFSDSDAWGRFFVELLKRMDDPLDAIRIETVKLLDCALINEKIYKSLKAEDLEKIEEKIKIHLLDEQIASNPSMQSLSKTLFGN